jgi:hypothetical protein
MDPNVNARDRLDAAVVAGMNDAAAALMVWGRDDCALWCAGIIERALGYDPATSFRGRYRTRIGARRVLGKGGLAGALRAAARRHGWRRGRKGEERVGDVGIAALAGHHVTVICRAPGWFVGRSESGFAAIASECVAHFWVVAE